MKKTRQISVFVANRAGRLASVARTLGNEGISIRALSLADAPDFGIFRLIVQDTERAARALKAQGFVIDLSDVIGVEVDDRPGGLAEVLEVFAVNNLNVEYMYAFLTEYHGRAIVFFRFEDSDRALDLLEKSKLSVVWGERLWRAIGDRADIGQGQETQQ